MWREGRVKYSRLTFQYIALFNSTALSRNQIKAIFGKDENGIPIKYVNIIAQDNSIKQFNKGTIVVKGIRHQIAKRYQLPFEYIKNIFDNSELLNKVLDATSDFYTKRQRRLIFNQIIRKKQPNLTKIEKQRIEDIIKEI